MCFICKHDRRAAIDAALQARVRPAQVRRAFELRTSLTVIGRHRDVCLAGKPDPQVIAQARRKAERAEFAAVRRPEVMLALGVPVDRHHIDDDGARRVMCAALLQAVKDAQRGDDEALGWINGDDSLQLVAWLNLNLEDHWPPTPAQIADAKVNRSGMEYVSL